MEKIAAKDYMPKAAAPVARAQFVRCEVGARVWIQRTDCRWQNSRFQGRVGPAADLAKVQFGPAVAVAVAVVNDVDRRELQVPNFAAGGKWFVAR